MSELIFIRHGQASFGSEDYDILSDRGREQSLLVAKYLSNIGMSFDQVYSGTLKRQVDTAEIVMDYLRTNVATIPPPIQLEGLNEYRSDGIMKHYVSLLAQEDSSFHPHIEKLFSDRRSFQLVFEQVMNRWLTNDSSPDNVEGWQQFKKRVEGAIKQITDASDKNSKVLIFSSGGVISTALHIATGMSPYESFCTGWGLVNTSITKFRFGSSGLILHSLNSYQHLEGYRSNEFITYR